MYSSVATCARVRQRRRWRSEANLADRNVGGLCSYCTRFSRHGVRCNNCVRTTAATRQNGKRNTETQPLSSHPPTRPPPNAMSSPPATQTHSSSISSAPNRRTGRKSSNRCQCRRCVCRCSRTCASRMIGEVGGGGRWEEWRSCTGCREEWCVHIVPSTVE